MEQFSGKTVTRIPIQDQLTDYEVMFESARRLPEAIRQLEEIGLDVVARDDLGQPDHNPCERGPFDL